MHKAQQVFVFSGRIMVFLVVSCGESSDSTVLADKGKTEKGSPYIWIVCCAPRMSFLSCETGRRRVFRPGIGVWHQKAVISNL